MAKIAKIVQVFNLDEEGIGMVDPKELVKLISPNAVAELIKKLKAKGYGVFVSSKVVSLDIPASLIVVAEIPFREEDFFEVAESLGIKWFKPGKIHFERPG